MPYKINPIRIEYKKEEVPYVVIEVNQKCNIHCHACYKNFSDYTKPLDLIKKEIEFALSKRKLNSIALAGGEPTLHPNLTDVFKFITSKNVEAHMLSNGVGLTKEKLTEYKNAGLKDVLLHIDSFQHRPDAKNIKSENDLNALREKMGKDVVESGIRCSLSVTLYHETLTQLQDIVSFVLKSKNYNRILVTCFTDLRKFAPYYNNNAQNIDENELIKEYVKNSEIEEILVNKMNMEPYAYIASNINSREKRWLYYYSLVIFKKESVKILNLSPKFKNLIAFFSWLSKKRNKKVPMRGPKIFKNPVNVAILYALFSFDLKIFFQTILFLTNLFTPGAAISHKRFFFQQGPNLKNDGTIEYCDNCPDATVRDGILTPLCMVDVIDKEKRIRL